MYLISTLTRGVTIGGSSLIRMLTFDGSGLKRGATFSEIELIRGMASLKGDNLLVFYYISASEIWSDKRGGLS